MKMFVKRITTIMLVALAAFVFMSINGAMASYADSTEINSTNFPDQNFRNFISENYDYNDDGVIDNYVISYTTAIVCLNGRA